MTKARPIEFRGDETLSAAIREGALARLELPSEPPYECNRCPRLCNFIAQQKIDHPGWWNGPVPTWCNEAEGDGKVRLLIAGLAPGMRGANRTGRPFTGDWAGDLLYATLEKHGFASGKYGSTPADDLTLHNTAITNAVRCLPPQNKPVGAEINTCRHYLNATIERFENLSVIVTLGSIGHVSTIRALGQKVKSVPFGHNVLFEAPSGLRVLSSYHCSRYNTNTGVLTEEMFNDVFARARDLVDGAKA